MVHTHQFKHPVLLSELTLQVNNARRMVRTSDGVNYEVDYVYAYDATGRALVKTGDFVYTNGPDAGRHVEIQTTYSYYQSLPIKNTRNAKPL